MKTVSHNSFEIIVIGGGHAGCEAALAASRMGAKTLLLTINLFNIAQMSCNPAIGGLAKGHLVKEIDALGGEMGVIADDTGIQFRMLNTSKGPSVWSLRTQNDRVKYSLQMKNSIEEQKNLYIRQHDIKKILIADQKVIGVQTDIGTNIYASCVILASGTFLNGLIHVGLTHFPGGRSGELASVGLSDQLRELGIQVGRLKTGTPPRIDGRTIDFKSMSIQNGDQEPVPFSYKHDKITTEQLPCYLTHTNLKTHQILKSGLDRSPLYTGIIKGIGPRYCPSIEDKIVRFSDKESHQIFLEPEGRNTYEYYLNGFATSLPEDIQIDAIHTIPGLEHAKLTRFGYAIEYDYFPPHQLTSLLESKQIQGLFFAGQINGTSGYEEAAAQGLMAGINAVLKLRNQAPFILNRSEAYIGVLIDDLVTKPLSEPYRMFTSLAEYRLLLRQDNADLRLMKYGCQYGLISSSDYEECEKKRQAIQKAINFLRDQRFSVDELNQALKRSSSSPLQYAQPISNLLKRPEVSLTDFSIIYKDELFNPDASSFWHKVRTQVEIEIKYDGFLSRQKDQIEKMKELEGLPIPENFNYTDIQSLSKEAREKFARFKPRNLGQASRILGVSPSDITILMIHLNRKHLKKVSRET
jgi:tRNA uridine 5-carboxymethylaminomethyl modification enzyme